MKSNWQSLLGLLLVAPVMLVLVVLTVIPALEAVRFSLGFVPEDNPAYASGLDLIRSNSGSLEVFNKLFASSFFSSNLALTLRVSFLTVTFLVLLAYPLALYTRFGQGRLAQIAKGLYLLPMFIPVIIASYALITFYGDNGWLEAILAVFGVSYSSLIRQEAGITLGHVWVGIPFAVLMLSSGLEGIGVESIEAAKDQGASFWTIFWRIILPMNLAPLLIVITFSFIGVFGSYTVPYMLGASFAKQAPDKMSRAISSFFTIHLSNFYLHLRYKD